jgi:hypothetical protein
VESDEGPETGEDVEMEGGGSTWLERQEGRD